MSAIGVFDSGVGGLTVVKALKDLMPRERIVYLGDTARVPYGNKSRKSIIEFSKQNARFLVDKGVKFIVVACNTVSATALAALKEAFPVPFLGVIEAGAQKALSVAPPNSALGVIGTYRTTQSGAYRFAIGALDETREVIEVACPLFVPIIEENYQESEATKLVIKDYLAPLAKKTETVILGCTHYPLLKNAIQALYPSLTLVDSAEAVAEAAREDLSRRGLLERANAPTYEYYVTDISEHFIDIARRILNDANAVIKETAI